MRTTTLIFFMIGCLYSTSCVTVKLANEAGKKAAGVKFNEPKKPFESESRPEVDAAWKNANNGNVISYISDCGDPTDPPLDQIVAGITAGLAEIKILEDTAPMMQEREGRRVRAAGKVDGVPTEIDLLTYKRNHCIYILSYVGVKKNFPDDRTAFNSFIDGFKAP